MRLSFTKLTIWTMLLSILAVAAVCVALCVPEKVAAAEGEQYQFSSITSQKGREYGDKLFPGALVDNQGRIYGQVDGNKFKVKSAGTTDKYIKASDIRVSAVPGPNDDTIALCNDKGLVQADVLDDYDPNNQASGWYYLTYIAGGMQTLYAPLPVYWSDNGVERETGDYIIYGPSNDYFYCQVVPRQIRVSYAEASSHTGSGIAGTPLDTEEKDGVLYVSHTYGDKPDTIAFAETVEGKKVMSEFEDELTTVGEIVGNNDYTDAGYYEIPSLDLVVKRGLVDVSRNYKIDSDRAGTEGAQYTGYGVCVVPRPIQIASFRVEDSKFSTHKGVYDDVFDGAYSFSTQAVARVAASGVTGQTLTVYYDVDEQEGVWDLDEMGQPRDGIVAITPDGTYWRMHIVDWTVTGTGNPLASNYAVTLAGGAVVDVSVSARSIYLYDTSRGGIPDGEGEWVDVVANNIAISLPYGEIYTREQKTHRLVIEGIPVTLSFEIEYEGVSLRDYLDALNADEDPDNDADSIMLHVGSYKIINSNVTDVHYNVTVHESVHWQVTPKEVSYDTLVEWVQSECYLSVADGTTKERAMYRFLSAEGSDTRGICVAQYAYDALGPDRTPSITFFDSQLNLTIAQDMALTGAVTPGYYALVFDNNDYVVPAGILYARILPVDVTLALPDSAVYDGTPKQAVVHYDGATDNPFGDWTVTVSYRVGKNVAEPVDADTYTVAVTVKGPDNSAANPYLVYAESGARFTIRAKSMTVTLRQNAQVSKIFADEVDPSAVTYDTEGLVGTDAIELQSDAFDESVAPGNYAINVVFRTGKATNYVVALRGATGGQNPTFAVKKISAQSVIAYFNNQLRLASIAVDTSSIRVPAITYYGIGISGVEYLYAEGSGVWQRLPSALAATGLKEGTKYTLCLQIRADGEYIETVENVQTDARVVVTAITKPILSQDVYTTTARAVGVGIDNYDAQRNYAVAIYRVDEDDDEDELPAGLVDRAVGAPDEEGRYVLARAFATRYDEENTLILGELSAMEVGGVYRVVVVIRTADATAMSAPLTVYTRSAAPTVNSSVLAVSEHRIGVPSGYYVYVAETNDVSALPVASVVGTTMQEAGLTFAMLAESGAELTDEYRESVLGNLQANKSYVIAIWTQDEGSAMPSDAQCFYFKTRVDQSNRFAYSGLMLVVSRYLLVGTLVVVFICFIICAVRYLVLRKRLSGGNR